VFEAGGSCLTFRWWTDLDTRSDCAVRVTSNQNLRALCRHLQTEDDTVAICPNFWHGPRFVVQCFSVHEPEGCKGGASSIHRRWFWEMGTIPQQQRVLADAATIGTMMDWPTGRITQWRNLTPSLATFRLVPEPGVRIADYEAGQYVALRRERCRLTRSVSDTTGREHHVPDLDDFGRPKVGPVTHPYSIASAPADTRAHNYLEFYVVQETDVSGAPGRLSGSLFEMSATGDHALSYFHRMAGTFTLAERARGFSSVLMVASGTGVAPFVSMLKQLDHEAQAANASHTRYTLVHANRTRQELAYHEDLLRIERARRFDFLYIASVSRPTDADRANPELGCGRANNLLRYVFGMPLGNDAIERVTEPVLPARTERVALVGRLEPSQTVLMTCGNPLSVADVRLVGHEQGIRVETEDW
jgi:ferredoxin-NADP reductase